jgi:hypothetical protein
MHSSLVFHKHFRDTGIEERKTMSNQIRKWKWNLLLIAMVVAAGATTASAQQATLKASVPFAFSVNGSANLQPGSYIVTRQGQIWRFRSEDSNQSVLIATSVALEDPADKDPSLTFNCVRTHCQVRAIHAGFGALGAEVPAPKLSKSDREELAVVNVPLEPNRGE